MLPKILRYSLVITSIIVLAGLFNPQRISAANDWVFNNKSYNDGLKECMESGGVNLSCYTTRLFIENVSTSNCFIFGDCLEDAEKNQIFIKGSLLNLSTELAASIYAVPPANTGVWLADTFSSIGIAPKVYAQGIGFSAMSPLLPIWKAMRNVSYAFLIIILLVIGLMIMLRTKIDPRTVISVQAALPRIVITIILITFSYPIAGLMIDLMYLMLFFGISIIANAVGMGADVTKLQGDFVGGGGLWRIINVVPTATWAVGGGSVLVSLLTLIILPARAAGGASLFFKSGIAKAFGGLTAGSKILGVLSGSVGILTLLVGLAFLFAIARIFFMLLNSYINLLINITFAPIFLLGEAIPGQNQFQFGPWMKNLISNLIVFPATAILILVAMAINRTFAAPGFMPWNPPMIGMVGGETAELIIGLGFALVIPSLVGSIKKMFGAKSPVNLSGVMGSVVSTPMGIFQQGLNTFYQFRMLGGHKTKP